MSYDPFDEMTEEEVRHLLSFSGKPPCCIETIIGMWKDRRKQREKENQAESNRVDNPGGNDDS